MIATDRPQYSVGRVAARSALCKSGRGPTKSPMVGVFINGRQVGHITDDATDVVFITRELDKAKQGDLHRWLKVQTANEGLRLVAVPPAPQVKRASTTDL